MFRDLKEYQEIKKLYSEKVSKPENLEENRNTRGSELAAKRLAEKPPETPKVKPTYQSNRDKMIQSRSANRPKSREEVGLKPKQSQGRISPSSQNMRGKIKPMPTTAEIRAKDKAAGGTGMSNIPSKEGNAVIGGKKLNPDFGKKVEIKKEPEISKFTKQGKERTPAQMAAAKRIGSGTAKNPDTTIAQVKQSNQDAMRARAKEKFAAFKAKRAEKKAAMVAKEEYTPYDIVLEYLLSSEQAATIEEANYVMTEMDAETIQGIVEEQKKNFDEGIGQMPVVNVLGGLLATGAAIKGAASYLGRKAGEKSIKNKQTKPVPTPKKDPIKDLIPNIKKRNKGLKDAINQI